MKPRPEITHQVAEQGILSVNLPAQYSKWVMKHSLSSSSHLDWKTLRWLRNIALHSIIAAVAELAPLTVTLN